MDGRDPSAVAMTTASQDVHGVARSERSRNGFQSQALGYAMWVCQGVVTSTAS